MSKPGKLRARLGWILFGFGVSELAAHEEVLPPLPHATLAPREIRLYVPAGGVRAETPVLLALDGQNMPAWKLAETVAALAQAGEIRAPLVVAVPNSPQRIDEYGLAGAPDYAGRGRLAAEFQRYLTDQVLPAVVARYGLRLAPERTGIMGASLGGLSALDLAWRRPDLFGCAGVFSGSLWWRGEDGDWQAHQRSRLAHRLVRETKTKPALRLWFEAGTADEKDDRDGNGVIDAIQDTTELIDELEAKGFRRGQDVVYHEIAGGEHNERTWAQALPVFLRWALPAAGAR
ncbi:MAG: esterase [Opitutus sp.]|nr:esterase [Opitutus sp.]